MSNSQNVRFDRVGAVQTLDAKGWIQGKWESDEGVCLHQCIRLCSPQKGDAYIIEQVYNRRGHGTGYNDTAGRTREEIVHVLKESADVTDDELAETFGPQWREIVALVRKAATLTPEQVNELASAWYAARTAARGAAWDAARTAAWGAAWYAARTAAWGAAWYAARTAAWGAAWDAAWGAAGDAAGLAAGLAARALVARDLIDQHGFEQRHYDTLVAPWESVMGALVAEPDDRELAISDAVNAALDSEA